MKIHSPKKGLVEVVPIHIIGEFIDDASQENSEVEQKKKEKPRKKTIKNKKNQRRK